MAGHSRLDVPSTGLERVRPLFRGPLINFFYLGISAMMI